MWCDQFHLPLTKVGGGVVEVLKTLVVAVLEVVHHIVELHILVTAQPMLIQIITDLPNLSVILIRKPVCGAPLLHDSVGDINQVWVDIRPASLDPIGWRAYA